MLDLPSAAWNTLATLSVLPVIKYSPVGLQARSYTCIVVHLNETRESVKLQHPL